MTQWRNAILFFFLTGLSSFSIARYIPSVHVNVRSEMPTARIIVTVLRKRAKYWDPWQVNNRKFCFIGGSNRLTVYIHVFLFKQLVLCSYNYVQILSKAYWLFSFPLATCISRIFYSISVIYLEKIFYSTFPNNLVLNVFLLKFSSKDINFYRTFLCYQIREPLKSVYTDSSIITINAS